jgi:type I restriction enzyme S subunit
MDHLTFPRYEDYKSSGINWLGDIPSHWQVTRNKYLFRERDERKGNDDVAHFSLSKSRGLIKYSDTTDKEARAESLSLYKKFEADDLVMNKMQAWNGIFGYASEVGATSPDYTVFKKAADINVKYYEYLFKTELYIGQFLIRSRGMGDAFRRLNTPEFGAIFALYPPKCDQDAITHKLDQKTAEIDEAIAKKQRLIELLKEQKAILINQAVTKGLNKTEFVETGNPFFPSIPASFTLVKLGHLCNKVADGPHFSPSYVDEGVMFISAGNIRPDGWLLDDAKKVSERDYREFCKRVVPEVGDVLYTKGGTTGVAKVVDIAERFQVWVHVAVLKLRKEKVIPSYLAFMLNSSKCYEQSQLYTRGATNKDLGLTRMVNIFLPLPPLADQEEIVEHLNGISANTTALIGKVAEEISGLAEYRSAMIAEAVTGKIKL